MEKARQPRSKKWWCLCVALAIIVLAIALGVGLGLGLQGSDDDDEADEGEETTREKWTPEVAAQWQIVLQQSVAIDEDDPEITPAVGIYDIDLFTNSEATIAALRSIDQRVICYFSAGSYEPYRPDSDDFADEDLGDEMDGWPDEIWVNTTSTGIRDIMANRIKIASEKGCDAVDPDNVDGYVSHIDTFSRD